MKVKVAFLGTGYIVSEHIKSLSKFEDVEISGWCDLDEEKTESYAEEFGGKSFTDYMAMIDEVNPDAVYVCIPPFAHNGQELELCRRNIALFVEKPISLSIEYAEKLAHEFTKNNSIVAVGYAIRYMKNVDRLRQLIINRKCANCTARYFTGMPGVPWWGKKDMGGGQVIEQSTHFYDLMRYLFGEVDKVQAFGIRLCSAGKEYDVEDASCANLLFKNGMPASVNSTCSYHNGYTIDLEIVAPDFRAKLLPLTGELEIMESGKIQKFNDGAMDDAFANENRIFIDAVKNKDAKNIKSTYSDALQTLKLTRKVMDSMEDNGQIKTI